MVDKIKKALSSYHIYLVKLSFMLSYLQPNYDISNLSNFKTPAKARYYFEINTEDDIEKLQEIHLFARQEKLNTLFLGEWTNMLFAFDMYEGIAIKNNLTSWKYDQKTKILLAHSWANIRDIALSLENTYSQDLWHRFIWLPGTLWWALFWNAGCFWLEIENNFLKAEVLDIKSGQRQLLSKKEMKFSYRSSILKEREGKYFSIKAWFDLSQKREKYHSDVDNIDFRENKQPKWNTCGSFFKNPSRDQTSGYLIEQVWLKWYKIWWAFLSSQHANFLMNDGTATYKDLLDLIQLAKKKVKEQFGIELVNEVRIIFNNSAKNWFL